MSEIQYQDERYVAFADALKLRGVKTPINGWAPGNYSGRCGVCGEHHHGSDKRSIKCLPCAVVAQIETVKADFQREWKHGHEVGKLAALEAVKRFVDAQP